MPPVGIQISWANGRTVDRVFDEESVIIGSGESATCRIADATEIADAHLLVMPREKQCWVSSVREAKVPVMYGGKVFDNGLLPFGSELDIGSVTIPLSRPPTKGREPWARVALVWPAYAGGGA